MKYTFLILLSGLMITVTACKKKGCTDPTAENYSAEAEKDDGSCTYPTAAKITIDFTHNFNGTEVTSDDFNSIQYTNADGNVLSITHLQYLISDITFYHANGDSVVFEGYHLVDLTDDATLTYTLPDSLPTTPFIGFGFNYGFDVEDNISGAYTDLNAASWSSPEMLGGGYHQLKMEGNYITDGNDTLSYQYHNLSAIRQINGSDTTFHANYAHMNMTESFNISGNTTIELQMDINEWYQNPNIWDLDSMYTTLMPNYEAQLLMKENSYSVFSIGEIISE